MLIVIEWDKKRQRLLLKTSFNFMYLRTAEFRQILKSNFIVIKLNFLVFNINIKIKITIKVKRRWNKNNIK